MVPLRFYSRLRILAALDFRPSPVASSHFNSGGAHRDLSDLKILL